MEVPLLLEDDSDCAAENRSCINFPSACPGSSVELVEETEVDPSELAEAFAALPGGGGIESPIWSSVSWRASINLLSPPEVD